jgi:adenosylmethionine-8-amino-7-oxononanoate aminotransferase
MKKSDLITADKRHLWHPFTQMRDWCAQGHDPLIIERGQGALLYDTDGREYIDGNSSIWTNIHGHNHPHINAAISAQLEKIAHSSFLGFTNEPAIRLAEKLTALFPPNTLERVFFTDDGSTAIECALKMAIQYWQHSGKPEKSRFAAFEGAYHGDTLGAATLGGIDVFHGRFAKFGFQAQHISDASQLDQIDPATTAAIVIEPLIQGAAGLKIWPTGMLRTLRDWCDQNDVFLIFDEVMTGFGRTGKMFACQHENILPDFIALAKGLTGGYLPLAATLTTQRVFDAFLGDTEKTFFYGHSYCGNALGCAAALASLEVFETENTLEKLQPKIAIMAELLSGLTFRQCGFIAGIDIDHNGAAACLAARQHGLLTRPIRNTIVLMPPLCVTDEQLQKAVDAIRKVI